MPPCCDCRRDGLSRRDFSKAQLKKGPTERRCKPCVERMCEDVDDSLCPEPTASNETKTKMCSACGKSSDALKKCTACKCVWYCDKDCQNKHWTEHKIECKVIKRELVKRGEPIDIGTEADIGPLGKLPPGEECSICMRVLPTCDKLSLYYACCGKSLCGGCDLHHQIKSKERDAKRGLKPMPAMCAFCRGPILEFDEEILARLNKRAELKDPVALCNMGLKHGYGEFGLSVDQAKCIDLLRQSADLGYPGAQCQLGKFYQDGTMGLEENEEEALKYLAKAAEGGHLYSRHELGIMKGTSGDHVAAMRHMRLSAAGGYKKSMGALIECSFKFAILKHDDLAETLQAFYRSRDEMRSEDRDQYIEYLRRKGEDVPEDEY